MKAEKPKGPLEGVVVLDLTSMLAGPYTTMVLGDLGARIIKIEAPAGDLTRRVARLEGDDDVNSFGGYFQSVNRNKESIVLDLKQEDGKQVLRDLVSKADVIVENYRSGVMDRLGLSYEALKEIKPDLVYGTLRGFGDQRTGKSPYDSWPAFDVVAQAMGGLMGITGLKGGEPLKVGAGVGDIVPGLFLAIGILSAFHHARNTGEGQFVDVSMYDSMVAICERIVYQNSYLGENPGPEGTSHPFLSPFGIFPTKDGHISIGCPNENFWKILAEEMGRPEIADDPQFNSIEKRFALRDTVDAFVTSWTEKLTKKEIIERLGGRIPLGPVNRAEEIINDPHIAARNMLATVQQPGPNGRDVQVANTPIHILETPGGVRRRAPLLGEDTVDVLESFGFENDKIKMLRDSGVIK